MIRSGTCIALACLIPTAACSSPPKTDAEDGPLGTARAAIELAPQNAGCAVISASTAGATQTFDFDIAPEVSTVFSLAGLPLGSDVFTATVYAPSCSALGSASPTWVSDPITATVTAGGPVSITFEMRAAEADGGGARVGLDFPGQIIEYPVPTGNGVPGVPYGITAGSDGNMWFTEYSGNKVARITPTGAITEFPIATPNVEPILLVPGSDGNLWFTEINGTNIGRVTMDGTVTEFPVTKTDGGSIPIAPGPDGALWFGWDPLSGPSVIGRMETDGSVTFFDLPSATVAASPTGIVTGPDGNLWIAMAADQDFTDLQDDYVVRMTPSGQTTTFHAPANPNAIAVGPDGNLWLTQAITGSEITRVTPSGSFLPPYTPTSPWANPFSVALGPAGNMWFTESFFFVPADAPPPDAGSLAAKVGYVTPAGSVVELLVPSASSAPNIIARAPDGRMWFTEIAGNNVAVVNTP